MANRLNWYIHRLRKMGVNEVFKRIFEHLTILFARIKYSNPSKWPYHRFADKNAILHFHRFPLLDKCNKLDKYYVYTFRFNLILPLDWYFSDISDTKWPNCHFSKIDYRPGCPYGDVRINWELNRLQFPEDLICDTILLNQRLEN